MKAYDSQKNQIRRFLLGGGSLTPIDALKQFGCFRLSAQIFELKKEGLDISSERVTINDKHFAKYYLTKEKRKIVQ